MSQYPRIWDATGLAYPALLDVLIDTALASRPENQDDRWVSCAG
jgi:hypothetical protein